MITKTSEKEQQILLVLHVLVMGLPLGQIYTLPFPLVSFLLQYVYFNQVYLGTLTLGWLCTEAVSH